MKRWKTDEIIALLKDLNCEIARCCAGGDYDTSTIQLTVNGCEDFLDIAGFRTDKPIGKNRDDAEVEMVYVSDGGDSSGGLNSDEEPICVLYGQVCCRLRKAGFAVVPTMDEYF